MDHSKTGIDVLSLPNYQFNPIDTNDLNWCQILTRFSANGTEVNFCTQKSCWANIMRDIFVDDKKRSIDKEWTHSPLL